MNRPELLGFQKPPADPKDWKDVRLARITYSDYGAVCSCGWTYSKARRLKVLDDAVDRHLEKRHDGRGIRL